MSMLSISSHMCSQATHVVSSPPSSTLFFSYLPMVWYVHFRTTKQVTVSKQLISLIKNGIHNGCNIQCELNNDGSLQKNFNLLQPIKVTLAPLPPYTHRWRCHKNIFKKMTKKNYILEHFKLFNKDKEQSEL